MKSLAQDLSDFHSNSPNIIIGTPGRVNKLLSSGSIRSSQVELVILDEADRLLDSKFNEEISSILTILPKQRRTGLFSASMSEASLSQLFYAGLRNPVRISLKSKGYGTEMRTPRSLELKYIVARPTHQLSLIRKLLEKFKPFRTIIFFPT